MSVAWSERLENAVGPIVVKEVRQGLRARVFAIFFGLLLTACLVVAIIAVAQVNRERGGQLGKEFLAAYLIALGAICYFVIPFLAFRSLLREREDETWVLLVLTGLGAPNIVRGKFSSAMSQALLFASACAPFVVFSYYLNGVDLIQVVLSLVLSASWTCLLTALALGIATLAHSRLGRAAANFFVLALLAGGTALAFAFSVIVADEGGSLIHEQGFVAFCAGVVLVSVGGTALVLESAAAGLALPTEAASRGPRIALTLFVASMWVFGAAGCWLGKADDDAVTLGSVATSLLLVAAGFFATSEQDGWTKANRHGSWLKAGALRGYLLVLSLLACSTVVWTVLFVAVDGTSDRKLYASLAAPLYVVLYLSLGVFLGRATPLARLQEPLATRLGFTIATALGVLVPPLIAVLSGNRAADRAVNHLNPLFGLNNFVDRLSTSESKVGLTLLGASSILFVFLAWVLLAARDQEHTT